MISGMVRRGLRSLLACLAFVAAATAYADEQAEYKEMREALADAIEHGVNRVRQRSGGEPIDPRVIAAMAKVPRHEFAPPPLRPYAYLDRPLPVGPDATISQPSLVAVMTDLLKIERGQKVLEVGIGGGYQTAILAEMTPEVMSVEFHPNVAAAARKILERLGYGAVKVNVADGYYGWRPGAPYDAILVRMAIPDVSSALLEQLKPGGRLIAPVGPAPGPQQLIVFHKGADGRITETSIMEVVFRSLPGGVRL
jgi:protein-L-isoaspartate(D-aspartate) O-methyltransferase